jgi:hypothetical protein
MVLISCTVFLPCTFSGIIDSSRSCCFCPKICPFCNYFNLTTVFALYLLFRPFSNTFSLVFLSPFSHISPQLISAFSASTSGGGGIFSNKLISENRSTRVLRYLGHGTVQKNSTCYSQAVPLTKVWMGPCDLHTVLDIYRTGTSHLSLYVRNGTLNKLWLQ